MTSFPRRTEKSKIELSPSQKGKNTLSRFSGFKVFLFIFVSAFFWSETSFAVVHSVENISEKVKGDRLSLSDVNSILGTIRGFFFDDLTNFVGIGTTNPTAKLEVAGIIRSNNSNLGTVEFTGNSYKIEGGANLGDLRFSAPRFRFYQDGNTDVDPLLNLSSGSVGIGTSNPGAKLEVNAGYSSEQFILRREDDGTNNGAYSLGADSAGLKFWSGGFATDSTPDIVFDSDGNVGIGTTSPDSSLHVGNYTTIDSKITAVPNIFDNADYDILTIGNDAGKVADSSLTTAAGIRFQAVGNNTTTFGTRFIQNIDQFDIWTGFGSQNHVATFGSGGNVGIGTTSPDAKLDVRSGSISAGIQHDDSNRYGLLGYRNMDNSDSSALGGYAMESDWGIESPILFGYDAGANYDNKIRFSSMTTGDRSLATGLQDRMVIDMTSGNVGIGTTSPNAHLEIDSKGGAPSETFSTTASNASLSLASSDGITGIGTGTRLLGGIGGSEYAWFQAQNSNSETGNNAENISLNPIGGNVGIGTTSPDAKLEVESNGTLLPLLESTGTDQAVQLRYKNDAQEWRTGVRTDDKFDIYDNTNSASRLTIDTAGNVGIGTTSPNGTLEIYKADTSNSSASLSIDGPVGTERSIIFREDGTSKWWFGRDNSGNMANGLGFWNASTGSFLLTLKDDNKVGIGTTDPDEMLEVSGSVKSNGTILTSDSRFKQNIKPISAALEKVSALRGVHFDWKKDQFPEKNFADGTQLGLIAQEVESVFPEVVSTDANGLKSVNYPALIAPLVQSIHTLKLQNEALQSELQEIKNELAGW